MHQTMPSTVAAVIRDTNSHCGANGEGVVIETFSRHFCWAVYSWRLRDSARSEVVIGRSEFRCSRMESRGRLNEVRHVSRMLSLRRFAEPLAWSGRRLSGSDIIYAAIHGQIHTSAGPAWRGPACHCDCPSRAGGGDAWTEIGSSNPITADPPVERPHTKPCTVQLFTNEQFADFNVKDFNYAPPSECHGPWAKVVFSADFTVTAGRQFDRTAQFLIGNMNIYYGTTSEPRATLSPSWHVESDVTDLSAGLKTAANRSCDSRQHRRRVRRRDYTEHHLCQRPA